VSGHGVLWNIEKLRELTGRDSAGFPTNEKPECVQPSGLRESRHGRDCSYFIHISRMID
jgi:hypothetical protein